jgi:uncharacterized protein (DUF433 family)
MTFLRARPRPLSSVGRRGIMIHFKLRTYADAHERIEINPKIMGGKPVIRGTRIPVELILRKLGAGMTSEKILADHPNLRPDDIRAAHAFAADYLADEELVYR